MKSSILDRKDVGVFTRFIVAGVMNEAPDTQFSR